MQEIEESKRWINLEKDESTYKRDLTKRNRINKLGFRKYEKSRIDGLEAKIQKLERKYGKIR